MNSETQTIINSYPDGLYPDCGQQIPPDVTNGQACTNCEHAFVLPDDDTYPRSDWQYEVANGDTKLGYDEWLAHRKEADSVKMEDAAEQQRRDEKHGLYPDKADVAN